LITAQSVRADQLNQALTGSHVNESVPETAGQQTARIFLCITRKSQT
jgi:hypothetical protein